MKHDGYRALAYVDAGTGWLVSRNGRRMVRFADVGAGLQVAVRAKQAVLDGKLVHLDGGGRSWIQPLRKRQPGATNVAFDLL